MTNEERKNVEQETLAKVREWLDLGPERPPFDKAFPPPPPERVELDLMWCENEGNIFAVLNLPNAEFEIPTVKILSRQRIQWPPPSREELKEKIIAQIGNAEVWIGLNDKVKIADSILSLLPVSEWRPIEEMKEGKRYLVRDDRKSVMCFIWDGRFLDGMWTECFEVPG